MLNNVPLIGVSARGRRGHWSDMAVMMFKGRLAPTAPYTLMAMGAAASRMLLDRRDGRSGKHVQDREGGEAIKAGWVIQQRNVEWDYERVWDRERSIFEITGGLRSKGESL